MITKSGLCVRIQYLNAIINSVNYEDCYQKVVAFFNVTSYLEDRQEEIKKLPLKGFKIFDFKSGTRKCAEAQRELFIERLKRAGRQNNHNCSMPGELANKDNIFFGNIDGICTGKVSKFETSQKSEIQEVVRPQIMKFISSFKGYFSLDWLR